MSEESRLTPGGLSPEQLLAEFESRRRELEAAGGQVPARFRRELEELKRKIAAGQADSVQFMQAGDQTSGLLGFSFPVETEPDRDDTEKGPI
jgi:hypothetical protein